MDKALEPIEYQDNDGIDDDGRKLIRTWYCCPSCGERVFVGESSCPDCGQELIWR